MKILHVTAIKGWGGGENHLENLCYELRDNPEVENHIFCVRNGIVHQRLQKKTVPLFTAALAFKMDLRFSLKLGKVCKKEKIDIIHIHDTTALTLTVMADYFHDLPPMVLSKKTSFPIKTRKQTLFKYNYPKIKTILCVSQATAEIAAPAIEKKSKLKVIYHGTCLDTKSSSTPFQLREKLNIQPPQKIIGNIANHISAKHLETFVELADVLVNNNKRSDFIFVQIGGFTKNTDNLLKKVQELKLQDHVFFLNFIPNASNFIPQFDISVVTSQSEGVPQVIYESFYHETPVVSTAVGGIAEIINHGENGLLAPKKKPRILADHILKLLNDSGLQKKFAQESKKKLIEEYTASSMAKRTLEEYNSILESTD